MRDPAALKTDGPQLSMIACDCIDFALLVFGHVLQCMPRKHCARLRTRCQLSRNRLELDKTELRKVDRTETFFVADEPQASAAWGSPYPPPRYSGRRAGATGATRRPRPVATPRTTHATSVTHPNEIGHR